ncbi:M3 family metallopeptidase [Deferribacterales bacterium RsTz2092]|nr:oligopeptidase A [Deferribacterales bacterium]
MSQLGNFPKDALNNSKAHISEIIAANEAHIVRLLTEPHKTYLNFVRPLADLDDRLNLAFMPISHLNSVKNTAETQKVYADCIGDITTYSTKISQHIDIYNSFLSIRSCEYDKLDTSQKKVLDDAILAFELAGVALPVDKKARVMEINVRMNEICNEFSQNLLNATNAYKLTITDESLLGEMPESDKITYKTDTGWAFGLQMPSYIAFMTYVTDRVKREEMYRAYTTRAPENGAIITEILALRDELAHILSCKNSAEKRLKEMAAPSVNAVLEFLRELGKKGKPYAIKEFEEMSALAVRDGLDGLSAYDTAYYSNKLKKEIFFDEEELRPYLESDRVVSKLFELLNRMFGITLKWVDTELWDKKAKFYEVYRADKLIGGLYIDLEARTDKRGGAWMNDWHTHYIDSKGVQHLPDAFIVGNFPPSTESIPSLLRHSDVVTLFHEMGHALHHIMSIVNEYNVSGSHGIEWDTIEFPSQFLENFAYSSDVLNDLAMHYETDERLPSNLLDKVIAARNFQEGLALVRQLEFGLFDMLIHCQLLDEHGVQQILDKVRHEVAVVAYPNYNKFQNGFSHIFSGGYAAGYYSYKWAEMYAADAYLAIERAGAKANELTKRYCDTVLAMGASRNMDEIYELFLGRQPEPDAILRLAGLIED